MGAENNSTYLQQVLQQYNDTGILPIDHQSNVDIVQVERSELDDAYELLQYSTELLLADVLDKGTFIKVKYLIDTMERENHEMVRQILHAKAEKNEQ